MRIGPHRNAAFRCAVITTAVTVNLWLPGVASARQSEPHRLAAALVGSWVGTLEYRDYQSDRRVTLPTRLTVFPDGRGIVRFEYTYDDGPGKTVTSNDRVTISADALTYRVQSSDGKYDVTFAVEGLTQFRGLGGTVTLMGRGRENDADVDVRITITVEPTSLTMLRESRQTGDEWRFRNRYSFTR